MGRPVTALTPVRLGPLTLRNRITKAGTFEGMTPEGRVTDALIAHHAGHAARGVALTTVSYAAVEPDGRTFGGQLLVDGDPGLARLADAVHAHGGAAALQLAHCGGFTKLRRRAHGAPFGPSAAFNPYGLSAGVPYVRAMTEADFARVIGAFGVAAARAAAAGFDAVEIHVGHGYLLSQLLSPITNRRRDRWGGDLPGRARLAVEVVARVRDAAPDLAVSCKLNLDDGVPGGARVDDAIAVARLLADAGAHALVPSGGLVQRSAFYLLRGDVPLRDMAAAQSDPLAALALRTLGPLLVPAVPYTSTFFWDDATRLLDATTLPVLLLGGVDSTAAIHRALDRGFAGVAIARALLADPDLVAHLSDPAWASRCTHCNRCVAEMDRGGVRCVLAPT